MYRYNPGGPVDNYNLSVRPMLAQQAVEQQVQDLQTANPRQGNLPQPNPQQPSPASAVSGRFMNLQQYYPAFQQP